MNQSIKPWLFTSVHMLNTNERASHRMLCSLNILQNYTKLDANGRKEMLHYNERHIPAICTACSKKKEANLTEHKATMKSISRNNESEEFT